jgi:hypothetical protein
MSQSTTQSSKASSTIRTATIRKIIRFRRWAAKAIKHVSWETLPALSYKSACFSFALAIPLLILGLFFSGARTISFSLFTLTPFLLAFGVFVEVARPLYLHRNNVLLRWAFALSNAIIVPLSIYWTRSIVNLTTRVDPGQFDFTTTLMSAAFIFVGWWWFVVIAGMIGIVVLMYHSVFVPGSFELKRWRAKLLNYWIVRSLFGRRRTNYTQPTRDQESDAILIGFARAFGFLILVQAIINVPLNFLSPYEPQINQMNRYVIAQTGYNLISEECDNYEPGKGERIKVLGDNKISVAVLVNQNDYVFEVRSCIRE